MEKVLLLKDMRKYIAIFDRINIRKMQSNQIETFSCMKEVPLTYDNFLIANIRRTKIMLSSEEKTGYERILNELKYTDGFVRCIEITIKA